MPKVSAKYLMPKFWQRRGVVYKLKVPMKPLVLKFW
jgi:hypothetical protein